jgi:adenine-specific DNA-methyltransferase
MAMEPTTPNQPSSSSPLAPRRRETAKLVWNSKPKKAPSPRDLEFQPAEIVFPNKASGKDSHIIPRRTDGEVDDTQMNRLIWGDNLLAMQALLAQGYAGKIQLIYIDPPFLSSSDYSHKMKLEGAGEVTKPPSMIERLAYRDTWQDGIDSYLDMLYPRLQAMRLLLADTGTLYVHLGPNIAPYVRIMLDEIFGKERFIANVVWQRVSAHSDTVGFGLNYDEILVYEKTARPVWNQLHVPYDEEYIADKYRLKDADGRRYTLSDMSSPHPRPNMTYVWKGHEPPEYGWRYSQETMEELDTAGKIWYPDTKDKRPRLKRYLDEMPGVPLQSIWTDIPPVNSQAREDTGFDTQKPKALLQRIIAASSNEGDLVADFFHGSGTTSVVAEEMGRRWIVSDLGKVGVQITRARLVEANAKPFVLENIGNYQRELIYREGGNISLMQKLVLKLFAAQPHPTYPDLGTMKEKDELVLVYVGYPDRPITAKKVNDLLKIARNLDGQAYNRLILLGWDYEYNFDENTEMRRKGSDVKVEARLIPPSIYEYLKKSKNEDDLIEKFASKVKFGAKPLLKVTTPTAKPMSADGAEHIVSLAIDKYVLSEIPLDDEKERKELLELTKGGKFAPIIDYWAVDWDYDGKTFRSRWQDFRGNGKSARVVATAATYQLAGGRKYEIAVRVVDVFGNDATVTTSLDLR